MVSKKGFSLIELVIVIVIIAILAAIALPRLSQLDDKAKGAVLKGALSAMKSSARIANVYGLTETTLANGNVLVEDREILMINNYPAARANNIGGSAPGQFGGLLALMEVDTAINVVYSNNELLTSRAQVHDAIMIMFIDEQCVAYQPPQVSGGDPTFTTGIGTYSDGASPTCSS
ncbi:prepilin-type N-terminal cleavage/methylation domain-containing protein [Reinekea sp.]|jgi:MSHA pilin protein MshA|uniref:prepilin-type N-terminal cleavage/methylation domain-containing protein n=1 Tax=Reinekea sp. TaxID=1970455 RepID=UPI002A83051B|nr:prepilin-type N-terminal cleavage/methylation domain-containing protein [Reinekea sp.]